MSRIPSPFYYLVVIDTLKRIEARFFRLHNAQAANDYGAI